MIRVLMVEDDAVQVELTRAHSAQLKLLYQLDHVTSAEAALALLRAERGLPDLILLDLNLPGMSGHELLLELKRDESLAAIPVVVLSAVEPTRALQVELKKHARAWVEKPLDLAAWAKIVKSVPQLGLALVRLPPAPSVR